MSPVCPAETGCCPSGSPCWWSVRWSWGCTRTRLSSETAPLSTPSSRSWRRCTTSPSHWSPRWSRASTFNCRRRDSRSASHFPPHLPHLLCPLLAQIGWRDWRTDEGHSNLFIIELPKQIVPLLHVRIQDFGSTRRLDVALQPPAPHSRLFLLHYSHCSIMISSYRNPKFHFYEYTVFRLATFPSSLWFQFTSVH